MKLLAPINKLQKIGFVLLFLCVNYKVFANPTNGETNNNNDLVQNSESNSPYNDGELIDLLNRLYTKKHAKQNLNEADLSEYPDQAILNQYLNGGFDDSNENENNQDVEDTLLPFKRSTAFLRFGRSPAYLRFGRGQAYLRFGRSPAFLRFGKRSPAYLRFGKRGPNPAFLRFGRAAIEQNQELNAEEFDDNKSE